MASSDTIATGLYRRGGHFANSPEGDVFFANGIDRPLRWVGAGRMQMAGTDYPTAGPTVAVTAPIISGSGGDPADVTVNYYTYVSFVRDDGRESALSPVGSVTDAVSVGADETLEGCEVSYTALPVSDDSRVAARRVYRTTAFQARIAYLDVQVDDSSTTTASSTKTDAQLEASTPYPLTDDSNVYTGLNNAPPPATKPYLLWHLGRMYALGETPYTEGSVRLDGAGTTVTGTGTAWPATFVGRRLLVPGRSTAYTITAVDADAQTLTIDPAFSGRSDPFSAYAIRPPEVDARQIAYSLPGTPEYWPPANVIEVADDGDDVTGGVSLGGYIYVLKRRHIYRFTVQSDPAKDGFLYLTSYRGAVNQRCAVVVGEGALMLDEQGVHQFGGNQETTPLSGPIQDVFRGGGRRYVNWGASRYFHAVHSPTEDCVRFFVALRGDYLPRHALAFHYGLRRWWVEQYPVPVGAASGGEAGRPSATWRTVAEAVFLGGPGGTVYLHGGSPLDGLPDAAGLRFLATGSTPLTVTAAAPVPAVAVGCPVVVISGRGAGQTRTVAAVADTLVTVSHPWLVRPDPTSELQVGGIPYRYETLQLQLAGAEAEGERSVRLKFRPNPGRSAVVNVYRDYSETPVEAAAALDPRESGGVTAERGSPDIRIDLSKPEGTAAVRFDGHLEGYTDGTQAVRLAVSGVSGPKPVAVTGLVVKGVV